MAYRDVTYTCGHTDRLQFYGREEARDRKQEWLEGRLCPGCYKQKQDAEIAAASEGLGELEGSEKQVAWAKKIRHKKMQAVQECRQQYLDAQANCVSPGLQPLIDECDERLAYYDALLTELANERTARFWIDHRSTTREEVPVWVRWAAQHAVNTHEQVAILRREPRYEPALLERLERAIAVVLKAKQPVREADEQCCKLV